jgi:hypothetical protein
MLRIMVRSKRRDMLNDALQCVTTQKTWLFNVILLHVSTDLNVYWRMPISLSGNSDACSFFIFKWLTNPRHGSLAFKQIWIKREGLSCVSPTLQCFYLETHNDPTLIWRKQTPDGTRLTTKRYLGNKVLLNITMDPKDGVRVTNRYATY